MAMNLTRGLSPEAVWNLLHETIANPLSIGQLLKDISRRRLNFFDDFNFTALDADVWTEGGDAGGASQMRDGLDDTPTAWYLITQNLINNDWYWHGATNERNKLFTPYEGGMEAVDWRAGVMFRIITNAAAFFGLLNGPAMINYAEPLQRCAHFFIDTAIGVNYFCRSYDGAEEQTDSGVAIDTDFHDFRILWTAASVLFYIDDVLVATHAAQVPARQCFSEFLVRTLAAAQMYMDLDYCHVEVY